MPKRFYVYIMTNSNNSVLYTGVTSNLRARVEQHRSGTGSWFTTRYNADKLIYFEEYGQALEAIAREKQIKAGKRSKKVALVESVNPEWRDVTADIPY